MDNTANSIDMPNGSSNGASSNVVPNFGSTKKPSEGKVVDLGNFVVVKRNGMLVPFRRDRVASAIEKAFRGTHDISPAAPLPQEIYSSVQTVTQAVVEEVKKRVGQSQDSKDKGHEGQSISVEGIQDIVEVKLMETGNYDVAKNYIVYRDEHKARRDDSEANLKILRRDGKTFVRFNPMKIASALERAFRATHGIEGATPAEIIDAVNFITKKVVAECVRVSKAGETIHVELVQDEVERQMMAASYFQVAKDFILYRAERAKLRENEFVETESIETEAFTNKEQVVSEEILDRTFSAINQEGKEIKVTERELRNRIQFACKGFEDIVSSEEILEDSLRNFYEGIRIDEVDQSNILAARSKMDRDPIYSDITARLLLDVIYRETMGVSAHDPKIKNVHKVYFKNYIERAIEVERVSPKLREFDLDKLADALDLGRDLSFEYLGLQTLYDRYLIHHEDRRLETPQIFWMRVSMGLSLLEGGQKTTRAIEFYSVLSKFLFVSSTPTLFNSGTLHSQMSSCYLTTVKDDLKNIFKCISDDAQLSKWAGGLGNDWTQVRATGSRIKGTNGRSQGVIPFLKVANDTAVAVNQGGKRKGAMCAYLETWHLDIEDFLELRKNTGDERRRTHDMNTANWIPDLFIKRVMAQGSWTLFSPSDVPDLHDLYGRAFEERYAEYEAMVDRGEMKLFKRIEAVGLWRKMLSMLFESGHPWITFKDASNIRSPQDHVGVVHSSNLCTEILLNTSETETAVCNLGSINIGAHIKDKKINHELLRSTIRTAIRMLDNVIDINFYPTIEAENANLKHRPIGLGLMGFQDALYIKGISYASPEAVKFADESMEAISYYAILSSSELAEERGTYSSYKGSKWDKGLLPIDTLKLIGNERGDEYVEVDSSSTLDWSKVRDSVAKYGMRNSNTMAIAPTATISNITGVTQSIEPTYKHLYAKSNLSGDFTIHNPYLVSKLKELGMWDTEMVDDLKYFDGSILEVERIPDDVKKLFLTSFEIEPEWLIECASRRQKWIDMGQSLNLYIAEPSGKKLNDMYLLAWKKGLKTTYYLRSLAATQIEKSTMDINRRGVQPRWMKSKSASSNIKVDREGEVSLETPKVCGLDGEACESCQ